VPLQLTYLRLGYASDEAEMVIAPAFLLTVEPPTANVTMGIRVRIGFDISLGCDGSL